VLGLAALAAASGPPRLLAYMTFERFTLDAHHFWISAAVLAVSALAAVTLPGDPVRRLLFWTLAVAAVSGALMLAGVWWLSYTLFDCAVFLSAVLLVVQAGRTLARRETVS
jgi:hypothetical protein